MKLQYTPATRAIALAFACALVSAPALADKGGNKHQQARNDDVRVEHQFERDNRGERDNRAERDNRVVIDRDNRVVLERDEVRRLRNDQVITSNCPPGLAKKNNGCMPPGQAKKLGYSVGQPLPAGVVTTTVPTYVLRQLGTPPAGQRYVRVGDDILLVSSATSAVLEVIRHLGRS